MHTKAVVFFKKESCTLWEAGLNRGFYQWLHVKFLDIDDVKFFPAIANDKWKFNFVELWNLKHPKLVSITIIWVCDSFYNIPILNDQKVFLDHMNDNFFFRILKNWRHILIVYDRWIFLNAFYFKFMFKIIQLAESNNRVTTISVMSFKLSGRFET